MKPLFTKPLFFAFFCLLSFFSSAQNDGSAYLQLFDPQQSWNREPVYYSEVTLVVRPQGLYTEVGFYFTLSDESGNWSTGTQLEATMEFTLPEEAIVNDSWLWIEDDIVKAEIIDRWTASNIYEEIVDRRQDPSILFKNTATNYLLRIYPLLANSSRKAKINFLLPNRWSKDQVLAELPYHLFQNTGLPIPEVTIRVFSDSTWLEPAFPNADFSFSKRETEALGTFYEAILPAEDRTAPAIAFASPAKDGIFLKASNQEDDHYYELLILPEEAFAINESSQNDVLVLLQYDPNNTYKSVEALLQEIQIQLKQNLDSKDRFNLIFSNITPEPMAADWLPATDEKIDSIFNLIQPDQISSFFLPELMIKGTNWLINHSTDGKILLFTDSNREYDLDISNELIRELQSVLDMQNVPIYIHDFQTENFTYVNISGVNYLGNGYLYSNLARITNGAFRQNFNCCEFDQNNEELFAEISSLTGTMDLYTSLDNGFCFNRFFLNEQNGLVNFNRPIRQVGRFNGDFPFIIEIAGELNGEVFFDGNSIPAEYIIQKDESPRLIWSGEYIKKLEKEASPNGYYGYSRDAKGIYDVIDRSLQDRILSLYTAFLALEPSRGGEPCPQCIDESQEVLVNTTDNGLDSVLQVEITPNPFRENVQLQIQFRHAQDATDFQFEIYNAMGQLVRSFQPTLTGSEFHIQLDWNGTDQNGQELSAGMYIFTIKSKEGQASYRLVKI